MLSTEKLVDFLRQYKVLVGAVVLTLLLQLLIVARSPVIAPDGIHFLTIAQHLEQSPLEALQQYDQHVGYPGMIVAVRRTLLGAWASSCAWELAARLVSMACGVFGVVIMWLLARHIGTRATANLSALLYALLPIFRQNASDALSDTPHLVLYLAGTLLVCWAIARRSLWLFLAAGVASGLAFTVRPEGLGVAIVAILAPLAIPSWWRQLGWRKVVGAGASTAIGAALLVGPYMALSGKISGKITSKLGLQPVLQAHGNAACEIPSSPPSVVEANSVELTPIAYSAPASRMPWFAAAGKGLLVFAERLGDCLRWLLLVPLAIGAMLSLAQRDRPQIHLLWALSLGNIVVVTLLYCVAGYIDRRHLMPLVGLLLPSVAAGLIYCAELLQRLPAIGRQPRLAEGIVLLLVLAVLLPRTLRPLHRTHQHQLAAARLLDNLAAPGDTVLSNSSHLLYYAKSKGKLRGGVVLRNGIPASGPTQPGGHRFVVMEQGGEQFHPAWRAELAAAYEPIATIPADASLDQNEIVIYERREFTSRSATGSALR